MGFDLVFQVEGAVCLVRYGRVRHMLKKKIQCRRCYLGSLACIGWIEKEYDHEIPLPAKDTCKLVIYVKCSVKCRGTDTAANLMCSADLHATTILSRLKVT